MSSIDERVVEMQFNNDQFESGIKQSTDSLDKFKESLSFEGAEKGLDSVSNTISKFSMDGVTSAVETASSSFSALETVATSALFTITNQAVQAGEQLLASLSVDQVTAGYDKYTQKLSNVQTIMNSTGESVETVNGYMDHLMWYSDETSYGFTDMTGALANMVATGGEVETLIPMIEGVANATAYAGQNATSFSYVMSAVNSAYSKGYMQATDWARIEHQNAASKALQETFIETAESLGKLEEGSVTLENFKTSLSDVNTKGWLDTEVMEEGFGVFSEMTEAAYELIEAGEYDTATEAYRALEDQYGEIAVAAAEAAQQAKTFGEAIDATKDAVSSKWSSIMQTLFGDYDQATQLWTDLSEELYDVFAQPIEDFGTVLAEGFGGGGSELGSFSGDWESLTTQIREAGLSAGDFQSALMDIFSSDAGLMAILDDCGSIEQAFNSLDSDTRMNVISQAIDKLAGSSDAAGASVNELGDVVNEVIRGDFGNGEERIQALTEAGYDYEEVQNLVNQRIAEGRTDWEELSDEELMNLGYTEEEINAWREFGDSLEGVGGSASSAMSGFDLFWGSFANLGSTIESIGEAISKAWSAVFDPLTGGDIHDALQNFYDFTESLKLSDETVEKLSNALSGLFSVLKLVGNVVSTAVTSVFNFLSPIISKVGGVVLDLASNIGTVVTSFTKWVEENNVIGNAFDKVTGWVTSAKDGIVAFGESIYQMPEVQGIITKVSAGFDSALGKIREAFPNTAAAIDDFIANFDGLENLNFDSIKEAFGTFKDEAIGLVEQTFPNTVSKVNDFVTKFKNGFDQLKDAKSLTEAFDLIKEKISNFKFSDVTDALKSFKDEFSASVKDIVDNSEFLSSIRDKIDSFVSAIEGFFGIDLSFEGISTAFSGFVNTIKGVFTELTGIEEFNFDGISQAFAGFGESIKNSFQESFPETYDLIKQFKDNFEEGFENISFDNVIEIVKSFGSEFVGAINEFIDGSELLSGVKEKLNSFVEWIKNFFNIDFSGIGEAFSTMIDSIGTAITNLLTSFGILKNDGAEDAEEALASVSEPLEGMSDTISSIGDAIGEFVSFIGEKLSGINVGAIAGVVGVVLLVVEAIKALKGVASSGKAIVDVGTSLSKCLTGTQEAITAFEKNLKADSFKKNVEAIAIGIATLVAAIAILGNMDSGSVVQGIAALTVVVLELIALFKTLGKMNEAQIASATQSIKAFGTALLEIAASVAIIVLAMEELNKFSQEIHSETVAVLVGILIAIIGSIELLEHTTGGSGWVSGSLSSGGSTASNFAGAAEILAFAAAVLIIAEAIKQITKVSDQIDGATIGTLVVTLIGIIGAIATLNATSKFTTGNSATQLLAMAVEILAVAEAVKIIASAVKTLAKVSDDIDANVIAVLVVAITGVALALMGINSVSASGTASKTMALAAEILAFAAAVKIIADAFKEISETSFDWQSILVMIGIITSIVLALGVLSNVCGPIGAMLAVSILALAVGIDMMVETFMKLANMSSEDISSGINNIGQALTEGVQMLADSAMALGEGLFDIFGNFLDGLITAIANALGIDTSSIGAAVSSMLNGIWNFIAGIPSSIAGFFSNIGSNLGEIGSSVKSFISNVISNIAGFFSNIGSNISGIASSVASFVSGIASTIGEWLSTLPEKLSTWAGKAVTWIVDFVKSIPEKFANSNIGQYASNIGNTISEFITGIIDSIKEFITSIPSRIGELATSAAEGIGSFIKNLPQNIANFVGDVGSFVSSIASTIGGFFSGIAESVGGFLSGIGDEIGGPIGSVISSVGSFITNLPETLTNIVGSVGEFVSNMASNIASFITGIPSAVGGFLEGVGDEIGGPIGTVISDIGGFISGIGEGIQEFLGDPIGFVTGVAEQIGEFITGIPQAIVDFVGDIPGELDALLGSIIDSIPQWILDIPGKIVEFLGDVGGFVSGIASDVGGFITGIPGAISDFIGDIGSDVGEIADDVVGSVTGFVDDVSEGIEGYTGDLDAESIASTVTNFVGDIPGALEGVAGNIAETVAPYVDEISGAVGTFIDNLSGAMEDFDVEEAMAAVGTVFEGIGSAIGGFIGNLIGGAMEGFTSGLTDAAKNLSDFMTELQPFLDAVGDVDETTFSKIGDLALAITKMTGAGLLDSIAEFITGKSQMDKFCENLSEFVETLSGITWEDPSNMNATLEGITNAVAAVDGINDKGKDLTKILGNDSLTTNLASFAESLSDIEWPDNTNDMNLAITAIADAATAADGVNVEDLTSLFDDVGPALSDFSDNISDIDFPDLSSLTDLVSLLTDTIGGTETGSISDKASDLATALQEFATAITDVEWPDDVSGIDDCVQAIQDACDKFTQITFPSVDELTGFSESLTEALSADTSSSADEFVNSFVDSISSADVSGVSSAAVNLVEAFTSGISDASESVVNAAKDLCNAIISEFGNSVGDFEDSGESLVNAISDGVSSAEGSLTSATESVILSSIDTALGYESDYQSVGDSLIESMTLGIKNASESVSSAVSTVCQAGVNAASGYTNSFYSVGLQMMQGLANGIAAGRSGVINAAVEVAVASYTAAKQALDEHSPSRLTYELGMNYDLGYANGIIAFIPAIEAASEDAAESAVDSISSNADTISSLLEDEMNFNPVITPVLDLSQVEAGAASMNGMFLNTPSMRVNTDQITGAFGAMSNFQNGQRNPNADLLSAIKGLDERLGSVRGNTYNLNGITYDDGTNVANAVEQLMHAAKMERRA